jgi:hypothetical protein
MLLKRNFTDNLLDALKFWLNQSCSCINWFGVFSDFFPMKFGVRKRSVLSPKLLAIYLKDIVNCNQRGFCSPNVLYVDNILLWSAALSDLQIMFNDCDLEMSIHLKKSCYLRIDPRFDANCCNIPSSSVCTLAWITEMRCLGFYLDVCVLLRLPIVDLAYPFNLHFCAVSTHLQVMYLVPSNSSFRRVLIGAPRVSVMFVFHLAKFVDKFDIFSSS